MSSSTPTQLAFSGTTSILGQILSRPSGMVGAGLTIVHLTLAVFGGLLIPHDPLEQLSNTILLPPSLAHFLGTDGLGRDVFSRTIVGGQSALLVTGVATLLAVTWGAMVGVLSAYKGGTVDEVIQRLVEVIGAFPYLLALLLLAGIANFGVFALIPALAIFYGNGAVLVARSATRAVATADFVAAARARGETSIRILLSEILPNIVDVIAVDGAIRWSSMLLGFSSLSFLGFGVAPPSPDWGLMISDARNVLSVAPWAILSPCVALASLIVGLNLLADASAKAIGVDRALQISSQEQ
ncbi:ABC transporter permease [Mesorhizobium onobrychidis]|uniref:ABC transporter permease n=1 Tax=Mesorhizobium onobrychidis TaxID=2775404 RepID=A0ABY5QVE8_9HYPH|nr:ABC transporter permease [Mesorhizobium onobrychidis]UVC15186.1 ABC transporter permease [Mesorhizobium onobrychidis]